MEFTYEDAIQLGPETTSYRLLTKDHVSTVKVDGEEYLKVAPDALTLLAREAFRDISFLMRASHNDKLAKILRDPEASENDRIVARTLLQNAVVSAEFQLPSCQDTGTATIVAKKGHRVLTD